MICYQRHEFTQNAKPTRILNIHIIYKIKYNKPHKRLFIYLFLFKLIFFLILLLLLLLKEKKAELLNNSIVKC